MHEALDDPPGRPTGTNSMRMITALIATLSTCYVALAAIAFSAPKVPLLWLVGFAVYGVTIPAFLLTLAGSRVLRTRPVVIGLAIVGTTFAIGIWNDVPLELRVRLAEDCLRSVPIDTSRTVEHDDPDASCAGWKVERFPPDPSRDWDDYYLDSQWSQSGAARLAYRPGGPPRLVTAVSGAHYEVTHLFGNWYRISDWELLDPDSWW